MDIKERLNTFEEDEKNTIITLGIIMYERGRSVLTDDVISKEKQESYEREKKLHREYKEKQRQLEDALQNAKDFAREREEELKRRFREDVNERVSEISDAKANTLIRELEKVREEARKDREEARKDREAAMLIEKENITRLQDTTDKLMGATENSAKRGKVGEIIASDEVRRVFKDALDIEAKGKEGRSGDFHVTIPRIGNIILDIKHHAKGAGGVRKKDREKLLRDLDEDKNHAVGAILVATQASIQGMQPGSVLYSPIHKRPMIACELRGDWDRLTDARYMLESLVLKEKELTKMINIDDDNEEDIERVNKDDIISSLKESISLTKITSDNHKAGYKQSQQQLIAQYVELEKYEPAETHKGKPIPHEILEQIVFSNFKKLDNPSITVSEMIKSDSRLYDTAKNKKAIALLLAELK